MADTYKVTFKVAHPDGKIADVNVTVNPALAPIGAKCVGATAVVALASLMPAACACRRRFAELLDAAYFDDCRMHRVVPGFIIQWGIPGDPVAYKRFGDNKIPDDPVKHSNLRGTISFATSGPNARGSQMFVNLGDNDGLDEQGCKPPPAPKPAACGACVNCAHACAARRHRFSPFAFVDEADMAVFDAISGRGEPKAKPDQQEAKVKGNAYLGQFKDLSYFVSAVRC